MSSHAAPAGEMLVPPPSAPSIEHAGEHVGEPAAARAEAQRGASALDWIAPVRAWQTVAWEAAALAAVAGSGRSTPTQTAAYAGAGALVGVTSLRIRGRCLAQWADTQGRYRYRRLAARRTGREADAVNAAGPAEPLAALLPDLGLAATDGGWVSAVRLGPAAEADIGTLMEVLRDTYTGTTIPLACAQLVVWTAAPPEAPAPTPTPVPRRPDLDETITLPAITSSGQPASQTLAQTLTQTQKQPPSQQPNRAPMRVTWLALRYRPRLAPHAAAARGGGELGAARAAASSALGLVARLDAAGCPAEALNQAQLGQELLVAVHGADLAPPAIEETWQDWSAGALRQACYEPRRGTAPEELLDQWAPGAAFTCASYTLSRTSHGRIRGESAFRVAGLDAESLQPPFPAIRANGRHQEFVLRTLPLAVHR